MSTFPFRVLLRVLIFIFYSQISCSSSQSGVADAAKHTGKSALFQLAEVKKKKNTKSWHKAVRTLRFKYVCRMYRAFCLPRFPPVQRSSLTGIKAQSVEARQLPRQRWGNTQFWSCILTRSRVKLLSLIRLFTLRLIKMQLELPMVILKKNKKNAGWLWAAGR